MRAIRKKQRLPIGPIDLRMKTKIGREPFCLRRRDAPMAIAKKKGGGGRLAVFVANSQGDLARRHTAKEHVDLVAKAEILCALPHIKSNRGGALAGVPAVKLNHPVFERHSAERGAERLSINNLHIEPAFLNRNGVGGALHLPVPAGFPG